MKYVLAYIKNTIGIEIYTDNKPISDIGKLPLFIQKGFEFLQVVINNQRLIFAKPLDEAISTPEQLKTQSQLMESVFGCPVVFVFDKLESYQRGRLIKRRLAFIVRDKQMYIPSLFLDLSEIQRPKSRQSEYVSPSTQFILIYHLWKASLEGKSFTEIAELLSYSKMTISRSVKELIEIGVCQHTHTKEKYLYFIGDKRDLWEKSIEKMKSPVKKQVWIEELKTNKELSVSGINALSKYSMLSGDEYKSYALSSLTYKQFKREHKIIGENERFGNMKLEIWAYDPIILSKDYLVDPFSLYLSLKDDPDERVHISLNEMMSKTL